MKIIFLLLISLTSYTESYLFFGKNFKNKYILNKTKIEFIDYKLPITPLNYGIIVEKKGNQFERLDYNKILNLDSNKNNILESNEISNLYSWQDLNLDSKNSFGELTKISQLNLNCNKEYLRLVDLELCKNEQLLQITANDFNLSKWDEEIKNLAKNYEKLIQVNINYNKEYYHGYIITKINDKISEDDYYIKILNKDNLVSIENCKINSSKEIKEFKLICSDETITSAIIAKTNPYFASGEANIVTKDEIINRKINLFRHISVPIIFQKIY